ncbi:hypothetical protein G7Z17_g8453 [Cylindrodendrum hubeiense]|uniref:UDENN domain-containing protein n=1 Tax=Cylindrodendrum hubeiense TaxID=595255 RepID=A0A9P5H562_9HYPO|nr:hypothetical protein G7Z17_g8453 [Cylindrodendrum hubeiense]
MSSDTHTVVHDKDAEKQSLPANATQDGSPNIAPAPNTLGVYALSELNRLSIEGSFTTILNVINFRLNLSKAPGPIFSSSFSHFLNTDFHAGKVVPLARCQELTLFGYTCADADGTMRVGMMMAGYSDERKVTLANFTQTSAFPFSTDFPAHSQRPRPLPLPLGHHDCIDVDDSIPWFRFRFRSRLHCQPIHSLLSSQPSPRHPVARDSPPLHNIPSPRLDPLPCHHPPRSPATWSPLRELASGPLTASVHPSTTLRGVQYATSRLLRPSATSLPAISSPSSVLRSPIRDHDAPRDPHPAARSPQPPSRARLAPTTATTRPPVFETAHNPRRTAAGPAPRLAMSFDEPGLALHATDSADDLKPVLSPIIPSSPAEPGKLAFLPLVTVVGFHHARGPEVENWFGAQDGSDPAVDFGWSLLPFMALSDGAHASEEDFSYFTLLRPETDTTPATSLFGISCTRQLDSSQLINRPADVTRSTVQKAVVVIADSPQFFGMLRERLSIVTQAWFSQREFTDVDILRRFQESLADEKVRGLLNDQADRDQYLGMSLRELIHEFKWQTLVLLKCCLLQPKMLFFGSRCDRLCMMQFSLLSLIPGLIRNLQDCADPELNNYEKCLSKPTSLRTSDRNSLLSYMGLPLQIFGKGSLYGPYTPLQQLDILADFGTKSYIVGSTNSLLLQQKDRYSDILINLDEDIISITSPSLRTALTLTAADRRWIDYLTQEINETWDEANPSRPKTLKYVGSEEFIRLQFEEYILALISSVKYHNYLTSNPNSPKAILPEIEGDPILDFGNEWVEAWKRTENYRMWNAHTDSHLFDIVDPRHPCAGGLTIDDVQRRIAEQVKELHLDERFAQGREVLGRNFAAGREKASFVLNKLYADMEALREAQRRRAEEARAAQGTKSTDPHGGNANAGYHADIGKSQQSSQTAGARAGAYVSSWAAWAGEKRRTSGWGGGWGRKSTTPKSEKPELSGPNSPIDNDYQIISPPESRTGSTDDAIAGRPTTGVSFSESILSGVSESPGRPATGVRAKAEEEDVPHKNGVTKNDGFHTEGVVGSRDKLVEAKPDEKPDEKQDEKPETEEALKSESGGVAAIKD